MEVGGYVDLAVEGGDEVGELAGATVGAEVDLAFEGLFEQRGFGLGEADIGARGAAFAGDVAFGELDPGADGPDVGVVDELGGRQGDGSAGDVGVGAAAGIGNDGVHGGVASLLGGAGETHGELGLEGEGGAVDHLEVLVGSGAGAFGTEDFGGDFERVAIGGVEGEVRPVEVDEDLARAEGDALEDLGKGVGDGGDLGGFGVDLQGGAEDDVAEVIATGNGGDDEDEGERGALVGAGEVDLAGEVEGVGAGAGAGGEFAEEAGGGAAGIGLLGEAGVGFEGGGFDRCLRAVGDALKGGGEAGWGGEVEDAEVLFAVFAGEVEGEGGVGGSGGIGDAGGEAGVEGAGAVGGDSFHRR